MVFDKTEEEKLIRKKYLRTKKELKKCKLTFAYLSTPEELSEILYNSFEDYFKDEIPLEVVEKFLTSELSYTYYENTYPFNDLIKIEESMKILNFLKSKMKSSKSSLNKELSIDESKNTIAKKKIKNFNIQNKHLMEDNKYYYSLTDYFINDEETSFKDFKNVLLKDFDSHDSKIHFICCNYLARELIFNFKRKFKGEINITNAGYSEKFISENGVPISQSNFSKSKTTSEEIPEYILNLLK